MSLSNFQKIMTWWVAGIYFGFTDVMFQANMKGPQKQFWMGLRYFTSYEIVWTPAKDIPDKQREQAWHEKQPIT